MSTKPTKGRKGAASAAPVDIPYPILDFRDADEYPQWKGFTPWRWEFLRRNAEYQALHLKHGSAEIPHPSCWKFGLRNFPDPRMEYPRIASAFRPGGGVLGPITFEQIDRWMKVPDVDPAVVLRSVLQCFAQRAMQGIRLVEIDTTLPIRPQLDQAAHVLESFGYAQPRIERMHPGKWRDFLRVLDGTAEGLPPDDIASVLYPREENTHASGYAPRKKVEQALKRARSLCSDFAIGLSAHVES